MPIDLLSAEEVFVSITYYVQGTPRTLEYLNCYAFFNLKMNQVEVRMIGDPPNMVPRAAFPMDLTPIVEHHGPHTIPERPQKAAQRTTGSLLNEERPHWYHGGKQEAQAVPTGTTPEKQEAAMQAFEKDAIPAEEHPSEKKYLEESPKEERSSYTDPEPTSVLPMLATPSGRFATSLPEPANSSGEVSSTELTRLNEPYGAGVLGNRAERRSKSSHKKPKQLPGVALLAVVALSLSVLFRHPQY